MDEQEIETTDLHQGSTGQPSQEPHRPSLRQALRSTRARRLVLTALVLFLALAVIGGMLPPVRDKVTSLFATHPPSPQATASAFTALAHRPLHLPAVAPGAKCPAVPARVGASGADMGLGSGPMYVLQEGDDKGEFLYLNAQTFSRQIGGVSDWGGERAVWENDRTYQGPVLIRGHQLDGPHAVGFNGGLDQLAMYLPTAPVLSALRLMVQAGSGPWGTYTRLQAPGCYAYQADGLTFTEVIVFQALCFPGSIPAGTPC